MTRTASPLAIPVHGRLRRPLYPPHATVQLGMYPHNPVGKAHIEALLPKIAPRKLDTLLQYRNRNLTAGESTGPQITRTGDSTLMAEAGARTMTIGYYTSANIQGTAATGSLGNVASGVLDTFYKAEAEAAAACGYTIIARLCPEFNGNWQDGTWDGPYGFEHETATEFIEGWKHVVNIFREKGATNVLWCWNPNVWTPAKVGAATTDPTLWFPGDSYVDYVGLDGYAYGSKAAVTFEELFLPSYERACALSIKPILICEVGMSKDNRYSKATWFNEMFSTINRKMPRLQGLTYWDINEGSSAEWTIDDSGTNPSALSAFQAAVNGGAMVA